MKRPKQFHNSNIFILIIFLFNTGLGGCNVFRWEGRANSPWMRVDTKIELPPDTLLYGELVTEHRGENKAQRKLSTFHIIDGLVLNGKDIRHLHIVERLVFPIFYSSVF